MATYLLQYSYTPESWAALIKKPSNRREAVQTAVSNMGGKVLGCWFSFGDQDLVIVVEAPDNVSVASGSILVAASGGFKHLKTTVLLTMEEGLSAMQKAGAMSYKPPTAS